MARESLMWLNGDSGVSASSRRVGRAGGIDLTEDCLRGNGDYSANNRSGLDLRYVCTSSFAVYSRYSRRRSESPHCG